jgi:LacI family transcriptional regulator
MAMTTIRDVAERAGVSTTTVSHVLNETRRVDESTAARVRAAIAELGYRPNALARSMRRGRTHTVGVVLPDIANPFFGDLARWLEDALFEAGYSAIICNSDGQAQKEARYLDVLLSKKVDGLVLIAASQPSEQLRHLVDVGPPIVIVDRELDDLPVSQVMVANHDGGMQAGRHLLELGHRIVGVIAGPRQLGTSAKRLEGFRAAFQAAGVAIPPRRVVRADFRAGGGRAAMERLLALRTPPSAVFAENDLMALGAVAAAQAAGLEVPQDLSVVGFDGIDFGAAVAPPLTTVVQRTTAIAATAVELLLAHLADSGLAPRMLELPVSLATRGSTGPPGRRGGAKGRGDRQGRIVPGGHARSAGEKGVAYRTMRQ